jgi:TP901 family phage tail tape measure protein
MAGERTLKVKFLGDTTGLSEAVDSAGGKLAGLGKAVGLAVAGAGIAAGGVAAAGVKAFADFEESMNEVLTLLPGAGQETFDELTRQTKDFSREFGVLPKDVVPALYQSLSAGIPKENVFSFIETAQKAARGGATDLTTAVDGISSVVNAYGADVLSATQASDLMFTAVRLGKTDFEQLSRSLFNVTPTAASLGIGLDQVTAGLARMTAQGVPTSVATTQLRALFVEASKDGSKLSKTISKELGGSFTDLIAGGDSFAGIMQKLRANLGDEEFRNLFGSVEAGAAALAVTGPQWEAFAETLEEMQGSAGATDAAFATMNRGISANVQKIKANLAVLLLEIGQRLAPVVERFTSWLVTSGIPMLMRFAGAFREHITPAISAAVAFFSGQVVPLLTAAFAALQGPVEAMVGKFEQLVAFFRENESAWQAAAVAIGGVLVAAFMAWAVAAGIAAVNTLIAMAPLIAIGAVIAGLAAGIFLLVKHWDDITAKFPALGVAVDGVKSALQSSMDWITGTLVPSIETAFGAIRTAVETVIDFVSEHWGTIQAVIEPVFEAVRLIAENTFKQIETIIDTAIGVISGLFQIAKGIFTGDWDGIKDGVMQVVGSLKDGVVGIFKNMFDLIKDLVPIAAGAALDLAAAIGRGLEAGVKLGINAFIGLIESGINTALSGVAKGIGALKGIMDAVPGPNPLGNTLQAAIDGANRGISIPRLARGGIVTEPTLALIGEAGPEAVVPLPARGGLGQAVVIENHFHVSQTFNGPANSAELERAMDSWARRWVEREFRGPDGLVGVA